jgi:hypothetical protein
MKQQEQFGEFRRFEAVHGKAVRDQVLKARREAEGPNWRPSWMEGMSLQSRVREILWEKFRASRRVRNPSRPTTSMSDATTQGARCDGSTARQIQAWIRSQKRDKQDGNRSAYFAPAIEVLEAWESCAVSVAVAVAETPS